ncbi:hypothetical protein U14_02587 [Candidatus Moduliflexus flocculans]|uniref:Uncharacterized protein n=1 Tax=Candidatus Moduliflexus flocculans TaxID=1499966 RepID=A0A081BLS8_9BACT|nr:hypothetical protein U14_02587 [Candidatus Moduliflexus flocculans]
MAELSLEDKAKGKRIITQFFRTMPGVQKTLMMIFERDGYQGVFRLQSVLYPDNSTEINSVDELRNGLSMILQHIYGMPIEDKEGYFQEITKCKTPAQVLRKEKESLLNYFYSEFPILKQYLLEDLTDDNNFQFMSALCRKYLGLEAGISDMRGFKKQIRSLQESFADQVAGGTSENSLVETLKQLKAESANAPVAAEPSEEEAEPVAASGGETDEKRKAILSALGGDKYKDLRSFLIDTVAVEAGFVNFQRYLDNALGKSSGIEATDIPSFSEGLRKLKEFRDHLEQEMAAYAS